MKWQILKPRRSIRNSVKQGSKKNIVLEDGELMIVRKTADSAQAKGVKSDIYIGNGATTMEEMKPAVYGDTSEEPIDITADASSDASAALNKVTSGKPLSELIGSLKRAVELGGTGGGGGGDVDIDYSAFKTKVAKSETNGNLLVDEEELGIYDDQELQAKSSTDQTFIYKEDGASIALKYYTTEKDIFSEYPLPVKDQYGLSPLPLSATDDRPIRVYLEPYYDNGYDKVWKAGEGRNKLRLTGLIGLEVLDLEAHRMLYGDEEYGIALDDEHTTPESHSSFEAVLVSGASLTSGTKYILNGIPSDAAGLSFEVTVDGTTKTGTTVIFEGGNNISIKLVGESGFSFGSAEYIQPMVRLATETDDSYEPYENTGSIRGYGNKFILEQENTSLDYSEIPETHKEFFIDASNYYSERYLSEPYNGSASAPDGETYYTVYKQQLTDGENIIYIEYYTNDYVMDIGDTRVEAYECNDSSQYGSENAFTKRDPATIHGCYRWKLNDGEWTQGTLNPMIGDLFLSRGFYVEDTERTGVNWYIADNSHLIYFTKKARDAFLNTAGLYSGVLDFGLGTRYDNVGRIIYNYQHNTYYYNPFNYYSDRDICDMNDWHEPSDGAFVIIYEQASHEQHDEVIFRSGHYVGEVNLYEKTEAKFTLYEFIEATNSYDSNKKVSFENPNGKFVFACRPGNALSRNTYNKYLTGDMVELKGYTQQHRLVSYVNDSSELVDNDTIMNIYPKKEITPSEINISIDGQGGYTSEKPIAWNESNKRTNLVSFENWSWNSPYKYSVSRYTSEDFENFYVYLSGDSSYVDNVVNITLCSNLNNYIQSGTPICLALKLYSNPSAGIDYYNDDKIDFEQCYMYLSMTSSYSGNVIKIKFNELQAKTIEYNPLYKYLGVKFTFRGIGQQYGYGSFYFTPIIRSVGQYSWYENYDTQTRNFPYTNITDPYGWLGAKRALINSLSGMDTGGYGAPDNMKVVIKKNTWYNNTEYDDDFTKTFIVDFSGVNFYSIKCPYNNSYYKYFYHLTRITAEGLDYSYYSRNYMEDYGGTVEIWSNVPIVGIGRYHYYYDATNSQFVQFDSSVIKSDFDQSLFYLNYAGYINTNSTAEDNKIVRINYILGDTGDNKWNRGRSNIPRFEDESTATTYATGLITNALQNDYYGIKVDLKNKKIYKLYDYIPEFYNVLGEQSDYEDSPIDKKIKWEDWKSEYGDCRYDEMPSIGAPALFRADRYFRNGIYVDSPCCWDITIKDINTNEDITDEDLILPTSTTDYSHLVNIWGVLTCSSDYYKSDQGVKGYLYMKYSASGFAYTEDVKYILEHAGSGSGGGGGDLSAYLTKNEAAATYLSQSSASSTYLTQSNASSTYLTQNTASSTYLTQNTASSTYATKTELSNAIATAITNMLNGSY